MTERTLKHELYKHGSYLISLKESGSEFVNIDDEIKKNEELFQMASKKDHQPPFAVGEYYADKFFVYKILEIEKTEEVGVWDAKLNALELSTGKIITNTKWFINEKSGDKPATAEQIATFHRAEHFASKGRKLDEFRVGDKVFHSDGSKGKIVEIRGKELIIIFKYQKYSFREFQYKDFELIQTAEELREVGHGEKV